MLARKHSKSSHAGYRYLLFTRMKYASMYKNEICFKLYINVNQRLGRYRRTGEAWTLYQAWTKSMTFHDRNAKYFKYLHVFTDTSTYIPPTRSFAPSGISFNASMGSIKSLFSSRAGRVIKLATQIN